MSNGKLRCLEVAVNISNQMLVIDRSFCYLPVNTQTFKYWQLTQLLSDREIGFLMKISTLVNRSISRKGTISQNEAIEDRQMTRKQKTWLPFNY
jgi:hypothetical protein